MPKLTWKRVISLAIVAFIISGEFVFVSADTVDNNNVTLEAETDWDFISVPSYSEYLNLHKDADSSVPEISIDIFDYEKDSTGYAKSEIKYKNKDALLTHEYSDMGWSFPVEKAGFYTVYIDYYTISGNGNSIERSILFDGKVPFKEAGSFMLSRTWEDKNKEPVYLGQNQVRSEQIQVENWTGSYLLDTSGYYTTPLKFYLSEGVHTLRISAVREPIVLGGITLRSSPEYSSYADVLKGYQDKGYKPSTKDYKHQAEQMNLKSDPTIYPVCDFGSASMEPYTNSVIKLNKISGDKFKLVGQWVEWELDVPETGLYDITLKYKQQYYDGGFSSRGLLIDGEYPFEEARYIRFPYNDKWYIKPIADNDGNSYQFHLPEGKHTLRLNVTLGDMADAIGQVQDIVYELNGVYRKIVTITGVTPDIYRDYEFPVLIPEAIEKIGDCSDELEKIKDEISKISGTSGSYVAIFEKLIVDLDIMYKNPRKIAGKLKNMKDNVSGLASWMAEAQNQPLDIDWIKIVPAGTAVTEKAENTWDNIVHAAKVFVASFNMDYSAIGSQYESDSEEEIKVWIGSNSMITTVAGAGRDQSLIIKQMADNMFTPEHKIRVNLQLVAPGTLLTSIIAGRAPDVSLQSANTEPMNYAIRDAVCDLSVLNGFDEVKQRFEPYALTPYTFGKKTFGLPETLQYPVLFYRKDIFEEQNLSLPNTWKDTYRLIIALQKNNMQFGMPSGWQSYLMLLYQNGGQLYTENADKTLMDSDTSLQSFKQLTDLYNSYGQPVQYDFLNRFRSGEMPAAIADFTTYNQLSVFAPEIKNLWGFAPVPGTEDANGNIDRAVASSGTSCIILSSSKKINESWEFLKWWTDTPAQTAYSRELESIMGVAARYPTANKEAFSRISWSKDNSESLKKQAQYVFGVPEVPGSYITPRYLDFAFQAVINQKEDAGDTILNYAKQINLEISRKRKEFNLN
ncbi:MAG: extracellular solute-binding protein [Oscillospiraceae bacterium]|nr:extracellular solute-binding protein [Oscillospiraceae bacterium]MDD4413525.1 extracellular solute-binding protein [Oscillospiraceae bacterium]